MLSISLPKISIFWMMILKPYLEQFQTSKVESCTNIVNSFRLSENSALDVWQGSEYASGYIEIGQHAMTMSAILTFFSISHENNIENNY